MASSRSIRRGWLLTAALVTSAALLGGCSAPGDAPEDAPASDTAAASAAPEQAALPEPDLEGIPEVVAVVNGTEISRELFTTTYQGQFSQAAAQAQAGGQEVDQDQLKTTVADNLVSTELLRQEADRRGIEASPEAQAAVIDDLLESNQLGSEEELRAAAAEQGLDGAAFDRQLTDQVKLDALIAEEAGDTTPTDQEIQEAYDAVVAQQQEGGATAAAVPPLEDVRPQVEEQLRGGKTSEATQALIGQLREDAEITVNL
jgi:peptidyl-prolyl cis-trans isomerase SurA